MELSKDLAGVGVKGEQPELFVNIKPFYYIPKTQIKPSFCYCEKNILPFPKKLLFVHLYTSNFLLIKLY